MVHLKKGQTVRVVCDGADIDSAMVEMVDQSGGVIFGACFASTLLGTFELKYDPSKRGWVLFKADGWTARQPNGAVYHVEVIERGDLHPVATSPEGAD